VNAEMQVNISAVMVCKFKELSEMGSKEAAKKEKPLPNGKVEELNGSNALSREIMYSLTPVTYCM
jgi:hypothetical protein